MILGESTVPTSICGFSLSLFVVAKGYVVVFSFDRAYRFLTTFRPVFDLYRITMRTSVYYCTAVDMFR